MKFGIPAAAILAGLLIVAPVPALAEDETPVPLPCDPADCGPVPIELPGCDTCEPGPAPDPGTAPGGPIE
ncbi:hypothetical protein [Parvibaculum sp.]|uniref:hypothetical protein n=1 Tax=Parvibaculum sp. TaxID=2024848 RepID=UPI0027196030|nr:hypothetical protein [Parvibaculum sp.]MDO9125907.1 hypothetical protein [Parvibaculum sp.]MDP1628903.1 hypothetical protein [Parvibaculum sp.]MDP2148298.1 hypothetical protein [Parvibaculum sp.]MDP3330015.1 hypothetical protein [Parvibaculum sp.]